MSKFHEIAVDLRPEFSKKQGWGNISMAMLFEDILRSYRKAKKLRILEIGKYSGPTAFWDKCFDAEVQVERIEETDVEFIRQSEEEYDIVLHTTFGENEEWIKPIGASMYPLSKSATYILVTKKPEIQGRLEQAKSVRKYPAYNMFPDEALRFTDCLPTLKTFNMGDHLFKVCWFNKGLDENNADTVIFATTCKHNKERAQSCRDTWMPEVSKLGYKAMLVIGDPDQKEKFIMKGDTLHVRCPDTYAALPAKTKMITEYFVRHCDEKYMFKCDDDTYIRAGAFHTYDKRNADYIGRSIEKPTHTYASGGAGYFLNKVAASIIAFSDMPDYGYEDWLVGKYLDSYKIYNYDEHRLLGGMWGWVDNKPTNMRYVNMMVTQHICRYPVEAMYNLHKMITQLDIISGQPRSHTSR
jgi:hypothetical protein